MNVEIVTEAWQFLFWEYINSKFFAVQKVEPISTTAKSMVFLAIHVLCFKYLLMNSCGLMSEEVTMLVVRSLLNLFIGAPTQLTTTPLNSRPHSNLIEGTFHLSTAHNFDAYLAELGVSYLLRRLASLASPTVTISRYQQCEKEGKFF
jgi:hypothetical protein